MPFRIILKQAACTHLLTSPVLAYYIATSFDFARKNAGLFVLVVALCVMGTSMRYLRVACKQ
jgi:hypothetical protein